MILVISWEGDEHAQAVMGELARLHAACYLLDLSRFPQDLQLAMHYRPPNGREFLLRSNGPEVLSFAEVRAIWWRRPRHFQIHREVSIASHQTFAYNELLEAFAGLWQSLDAKWVNHPTRDDVAARKAYQLRVAQEVGLTIPATLITSSPVEARDFVAKRGIGHVVYKAFSATEQAWRETRLLRQDELDLVDSVRFAPVIFQEYIQATVDLRVTIVGDEIFPAAIHSQESSYAIDFRMDMGSVRIEPSELPREVEDGLRALMSRLGLVYGAVDMRLTPDGRYVFLEINPAGQWLFIEQRTGQPISAALARHLWSRDKDPGHVVQ